MRNDAAAKERRRQRASDRLARLVVPDASPAQPKYRTPDTPADMLAFARELGWEYRRTRDGYAFRHPSGATANMHLTVSDKAAWRNLRCQLLRPIRRNGLDT